MYCTKMCQWWVVLSGGSGTAITRTLVKQVSCGQCPHLIEIPVSRDIQMPANRTRFWGRAGARGPCDFNYLRLESESKKSVFGNSVFPSATIFEGYTQAESRNAVSPSRFFVEKNHGSQPPATAYSIIFTSFRCSGKKHEFQNVVRNLNFKKSSRCYIGFRMGVPDMGVDLGYIYAKYPLKTLNKLSTSYGKFFYIYAAEYLPPNFAPGHVPRWLSARLFWQ